MLLDSGCSADNKLRGCYENAAPSARSLVALAQCRRAVLSRAAEIRGFTNQRCLHQAIPALLVAALLTLLPAVSTAKRYWCVALVPVVFGCGLASTCTHEKVNLTFMLPQQRSGLKPRNLTKGGV